ncbi:TIGR04104 family putative zinc finger protein [Solibacillus isronensis]|uniref:TIGR04104 family putative zinc finger protein n=1 Tax=Solibacillus isronensis TaxID=412383 RepID=UPI0009A84CC1|nr:TIGR04104 family putative zinc finger protein [Solibacillus isronensis]
MIKEKWQQELSKMQLTERQKLNLKQTVDRSKRPKRQTNWSIVIAPIFVFTAVFILYLFTNDVIVSPPNQASSPVLANFDREQLAEDIRRGKHVAIISLLLIINGVFFTIVFFTMKRWQKPKVLQLRKTVYKLRYLLIAISPFIVYAIGSLIQMFEVDIQWLKLSIFMLILILQIVLLFYFARNTTGEVCCPHCRHSYSKKEQIKIVCKLKMELRCPTCNEKLFYTKKYRQIIGGLSMLTSPTIIFSSSFDLPITLTILCLAFYVLTMFFVVMPLYLELTEKEEFLF